METKEKFLHRSRTHSEGKPSPQYEKLTTDGHFVQSSHRLFQQKKQPLSDVQQGGEWKRVDKEKLEREKCRRDCFFEIVTIKQKLKAIEEQEYIFTKSANGSRIREKIANMVRQYEIDLQKHTCEKEEIEIIQRSLKAISLDLETYYQKHYSSDNREGLVDRRAAFERGKKQFQTKVDLYMCRLDREEPDDEPPAIERRTTVERRSYSGLMRLFYASNVNEDWERLERLFQRAKEEEIDLVVLTKLLNNPLDRIEQSSYKHAFSIVKEAFSEDHTFSDIQQFIDSFRIDCSKDIVAVSARKILQHIEYGKEVIAVKIQLIKRLICEYKVKVLIVPGPYENVDLIEEIDSHLAANYLSVSKKSVKGINILGVGGQPLLIDTCPLFFQNRDYFEGTEQANEELGELFRGNIDLLVSYAPIKFFTDNEYEEKNIRPYLCKYLPGKMILTSQELPEKRDTPIKTATDAELLRGGFFGQREGESGFYWKLLIDKKGLVEKFLEEIE